MLSGMYITLQSAFEQDDEGVRQALFPSTAVFKRSFVRGWG
jgi:hypothetical protein